MSVLQDAIALVDSTRATMAHARQNPFASETRARLDEAIRNTAALRCRTDLVAAERLARARARLASLTPTSSPWQRLKAVEASEAAADLVTTAANLLDFERALRELAYETAILHGAVPR